MPFTNSAGKGVCGADPQSSAIPQLFIIVCRRSTCRLRRLALIDQGVPLGSQALPAGPSSGGRTPGRRRAPPPQSGGLLVGRPQLLFRGVRLPRGPRRVSCSPSVYAPAPGPPPGERFDRGAPAPTGPRGGPLSPSPCSPSAGRFACSRGRRLASCPESRAPAGLSFGTPGNQRHDGSARDIRGKPNRVLDSLPDAGSRRDARREKRGRSPSFRRRRRVPDLVGVAGPVALQVDEEQPMAVGLELQPTAGTARVGGVEPQQRQAGGGVPQRHAKALAVVAGAASRRRRSACRPG